MKSAYGKQRGCAVNLIYNAASLGLLSQNMLPSEVIEANHIIFNTETMQQVEHRLGHHWRTAEIVLTILGRLMLLEICVAHYWCHKAWCVLDASSICLGIGTVQSQVEMK